MSNKKRKCKHCKEYFYEYIRAPVGVFCTYAHAIKWAAEKRNAALAKEQRERLAKIRKSRLTLHDYTKKAQAAFNSYIRARDRNKPCISSGKPLETEAVGGGFDCGHYRSVGSAPHLRFNVFNAHGQTKKDNRYLSGNAIDYRRGLIQRIGLDRVEKLEAEQAPKKYSKHELERIRRIFSKRARLYLKLFR